MSETPSKGDADTASPYHARKDRPCPFCNKPFTSSSLGRHLDLWIKEKNPKPEDGIHDVEQIRKMRGAVTRRQQKKLLGSRRHSSSSVATSAATPAAASGRSPTAPEHVRPPSPSLARKDSAPAIPGFNIHNFAVTGVINEIGNGPSPSTPTPAQDGGAQQSRVSQLNVDVARKIQDAEDTARAAELALREMVSSWRAAKLHIDMTSMPFDFDPLSLDFPALTLQCLQPPPTLSSFNPFPTETSWSIDPPGDQQHTALRAYFSEVFRKWRIKCAAATTALQEDIQYPPSMAAFTDDPLEAVRRAEKIADDLDKKVNEHIGRAYSIWEALPQHRRQETWVLELARSIGEKQTQIDSMQEEQDRLRQENSNLRSQIDQLNKLQQPREFKLMVPATGPVDPRLIEFWQERAVVHGRRSVGMDFDNARTLDIGTLVSSSIDRWKRVVVSSRPAASGVLGKRTAEQAGMNGEAHGDNATSSRSMLSMHNKARAFSTADGRPERRSGRAGASERVGDAVTAAGGMSRQLAPTPGGAARPGTMTNGSMPIVQPTRPDTGADVDVSDHDDDLSDRDAHAEHDDDGMTDKDADAEMEDDDGPGYSPTNLVAADQSSGLPTSRVSTSRGGDHRGSAGANGGVQGAGAGSQSGMASMGRSMSLGNARASSISQHSN